MVADALGLPGLLTSLRENGEEDCSKDGDDRDDNE
jgi:hypothetical protein